MSAIGKFFVLLNLSAAVGLLMWATSLYVNRLEYVDRKTEDGEVVRGQISILADEIKKLTLAIDESDREYGKRLVVLDTLEKERLYRAAALDRKLAKARSGTGEKPFTEQVKLAGASPLLKLFPGDTQLNDVDKDGEIATDVNKKPLRGLNDLQNELSTTAQDATKLAGELLKLRTDHSELSEKIKTSEDKTDVQREILANLLEQEKFLGSAQINWDEELRVVQSRLKQLEKRIASVTPEK